MGRWGLGAALVASAVVSVVSLVSGGALAAPGPAPDEVEEGVDPDEIEPDESPPPKGTPLTAAEIAALERVMAVHEAMLGAIEANRASAPAATRALSALADAKAKVIAEDGRALAVIKKRIVEEDDQAASLSLPDALLARIDRSAGRWVALMPDIERMLAHEPFADALMRFVIPLL